MITNRRLECHKERQLSFRLEALTRKKQKRQKAQKNIRWKKIKKNKGETKSRKFMFDFAKTF